jgi:hypothetical protein
MLDRLFGSLHLSRIFLGVVGLNQNLIHIRNQEEKGGGNILTFTAFNPFAPIIIAHVSVVYKGERYGVGGWWV